MRTIYLDNAATTWPKPKAVSEAIVKAMTEAGGNPGRSGHALSLAAGRLVYAAREELAELFHVDDPMRFVFTQNCTHALNEAIYGCVRDGDVVAASRLDHNSVLRPLHHLQEEGRIRLRIGDTVREAIGPDTTLAVITHASNVTGQIQPMEELLPLCQAHGIRTIADLAQTAGILPISLTDWNVDLAAMPGHKALFGPQGTGALYIRDGIFLRTRVQGGTGSSSESVFQPDEMPERFESGTQNAPGLAGLAEGVRFVRRNRAEIHAHEVYLTKRLLDGLHALPGCRVYGPETAAGRTGTVAINLGTLQSGAVADFLAARGICVRGGLHCAPLMHRALGTLRQGAVRLSIGAFTSVEEIDAALGALRDILQQSGSPY